MATNNVINQIGPNPIVSAYLGTNIGGFTGNNSYIESTVVFDTAITGASHYNTSTGYFTAPASGYYSFSAIIQYGNSDVVNKYAPQANLVLPNASLKYSMNMNINPAGIICVPVTAIVYMAAGDPAYFSGFCYAASAVIDLKGQVGVYRQSWLNTTFVSI